MSKNLALNIVDNDNQGLPYNVSAIFICTIMIYIYSFAGV